MMLLFDHIEDGGDGSDNDGADVNYHRTVCLDVFGDCIWEAPCICFAQSEVTKLAAPVTKVTSMGSPKRKLEYHTILREKATVEEVEKAVEVPRVEVAAWQDF